MTLPLISGSNILFVYIKLRCPGHHQTQNNKNNDKNTLRINYGKISILVIQDKRGKLIAAYKNTKIYVYSYELTPPLGRNKHIYICISIYSRKTVQIFHGKFTYT